MTDFLQPSRTDDGARSLTPEGQKVIAYINGAIAEAIKPGASPDLFNRMAGAYKYYANFVAMTHMLTPEKFVEDYHTSVESVYDYMLTLEAQDKVTTEATQAKEAVSGLEEKLATLEILVKQQAEQIQKFEAERKNKGKAKADAESEA